MTARRLTVGMAVAIAAVIMVPTAIAAKKPPKLKATFGPGLTFDVKKGKKLVSSGSEGAMTLKARKYRLTLKDNSRAHNYVLENSAGKTIKGKRGRKNKKVITSVSGVSKKAKTFVIDLKPGSYTLICVPHEAIGMTVDITVK